MAKKVIVIFLMLVFVFSAAPFVNAADSHSVVINVSNALPFPVYKEVTISANIPELSVGDKVAVFSKGKEIPVQILSNRAHNIRFKVALSFAPNETKTLVLKYGKNIKPDEEIIYVPSFSGTYFVGIGSGSLYIISLTEKNNVVVKTNSGETLFSGVLNKKEYKIVPLSRDEIFTIQSDAPVFAEVSSLKKNCLENSSDDVSSVFGTYFILYIPKEIVVSSYAQTKLTIKTLSGKSIYNGVLPARGQYKNFSLSPGFYEIFADHPVTIQFGCEDDNIYAINYGTSKEFKGVAYGNVVCSALFPNTSVRIKTPYKTYPSVNLSAPGDYTYKVLFTKYKDNYTETVPVFIQYSKPVLIYSDSNHGNIGGEQIPSLFGQNEHFIFLTGKIFNFSGIIHQRKVVVIPQMSDTTIHLNGKEYKLNGPLMPRTFLFKKSYTLVKIDSNRPISVFEAGITTSIEFLSMLLPLKDNSITYAIGAVPPAQGSANQSGNKTNPGNTIISKYLMPVAGFFGNIWTGFEKNAWFKNITDTLTQFWRTISPSLNNLSKQIIALFIPVAQMVYPYVHPYFSGLTVSELAAILFYILLILIIILLIPKRRKKNLPVERVTETELKKKKVAFNVKTIEEKGMAGIKVAPPGKPKSLNPQYAKHEKATTSSAKPSALNVERKSITVNKPVKEAKASTQSKTTSPLSIFKKKTVTSGGVKETPEKKSIKKTSEARPLDKTAPLPVKKITENKKETVETRNEIAESEEFRRKKALEKILHKKPIEISETKAKKEVSKEAVLHEEKAVSETKYQSDSERVAEVLKKLRETTARIAEQSQKHKENESVMPIKKPVKQVEEAAKKAAPELEGSQQKEVVKERKETNERPVQKEISGETPKKRNILGLGALHRKRLEAASKETAPKETNIPDVVREEKIARKSEEKVTPPAIKQPLSEKEKLPKKEETKKEVPEEEAMHSSLSELLERVRRETPKKKVVSNIPETSNEALIKETEEAEESVKPKAPAISGSVVLDSKSLSKLYKKHALEHLNRIMMSAKEQVNVDPDVKSKYRVSVISLTAIEMRIAEDLARRINAKKITGELILIAKKTRISTVIVDDKPKITNYQGIKILNVDEISLEE